MSFFVAVPLDSSVRQIEDARALKTKASPARQQPAPVAAVQPATQAAAEPAKPPKKPKNCHCDSEVCSCCRDFRIPVVKGPGKL